MRLIQSLLILMFLWPVVGCHSKVVVKDPNPPKARPAQPGPNYVWVPGHWKRGPRGRRVWVAGHWKRR